MKAIRIIMIFGFILCHVGVVSPQSASDYLILQSIGSYHSSGKGKCGIGSGIVAATGHFKEDHNDLTCRTGYYNTQQDLAASVQFTQHAGGDSDRWLSHEVDTDFRNYFGIPGRAYGPRQIDGQTILEDSVGGANYRWLSGNKVIMIEYRDPQLSKPEPMEVVRAYLAKHPSTLPPIGLVNLRSAEYKTIWIKDEMERRLWLCDKWFVQLESDRSKLSSILKTIADHIVVFLNYREKYYGISGEDDKLALMGYLSAKNEAGIRSKLTEYKNWWNVNKTKPINLP